MTLEGGCYCGALRYQAVGEPVLRAQCHCRECQYFSGGGPNYFMLMPIEGFRYVLGAPQTFQRDDIHAAVTRDFCGTCGTHITTRRPDMRSLLVLKAGTLDDPSLYDQPRLAIFCIDRQPFHQLPDALPLFERMPPPRQ
ncbi:MULTISPECIES: GFA family protein [unclassified Minwuia]|uniref:GFA family protein n=1 Tax=unclassified Minwuia TaxID=2618799 RepID=UPI0024791CEC|nr:MULTISPECIES: GFA family protein [unclassified Minwuia]